MNTASCSATRDPSDAGTLPGLIERLRENETRENADVVAPLSKIRMTVDGTAKVPSIYGDLALTDFARNQLARLLGVRWDRWFEGSAGQERAEELNRRLARVSSDIRVRVRSYKKADGSDGVIRAIVGPTYTPISDVAVAQVVQNALADVEPEPRLIRADMTELSSSYVVRVGAPFHAGGPGEVGEVWGGLMVRNSGVGFAKISVSTHLTRICCLNGMVAPVPDATIVRSVHRHLNVDVVQAKLADGLRDVRARLHRGVRALEDAGHHQVDDAEAEVRQLLRGSRIPLSLVSDVMEGYRREPHQTRFGIAQAITWAAQRTTPETRYEMERAAGAYLARGA